MIGLALPLPGLPELASAHGAALDRTMGWVHLLMLALLVGWGTYFVIALVRFRRSRQPRASYAGTRTRAARWIELGVVAAEAILLAGFSIPLVSERFDELPEPEEAVVVRVVAEQFAWNVHYPGPDGVFGRTAPEHVDKQANPLGLDRSDPAADDDVTTLNQLHLAVDRPALIYLSSKDVIHSFMLNELRIKQDAVPGVSTPVWFVPTVSTAAMRRRKDPEFQYEIACAQLCGLGHYRMRGFLTIHEPGGLERWLESQAAPLRSYDDGGDDDAW